MGRGVCMLVLASSHYHNPTTPRPNLVREVRWESCLLWWSESYVGRIQVVLVIQYKKLSNSPSILAGHCNVVVLYWYCTTLVILFWRYYVGGLY
jgi:hypothetical protein